MSNRWQVVTVLLVLDVFSLAVAFSVHLLGDPLELTRLPVGDGKFSLTTPQRGVVFVCAAPRTEIGGAFRAGPWIRSDGTFDFTAKAVVDGSVNWQSVFTQTLEGNVSRISGNGLPGHPTGVYPIASSDDAYQYDRNPNRIAAQRLEWNFSADPKVATQPTCTSGGAVGVMLSGAVIYNALDAGGRDALAHETQDACQGHPDPRGSYHYHSLSSCAQDTRSGQSKLLGYALDGFGIYGPRDEFGRVLTNADLDECHGRTAEVEWRGKRVMMYHYVATLEYPYTVGCFRGTPIRPPR
jgi:hypothetical protein